MTFTGTLNVHQTGHSMFHLSKFDEDYLVPFPNFKVKGFFSAHLYPEIYGTYYIVSSSGYTSEITYSGKGIFGGAKNHFEAKVYRQDDENKKPIYTVKGCWSESFSIFDGPTGNLIKTWSPEQHTASPLDETPIEQQDAWETRRAWAEVISALKSGDLSRASAEKHKVEEAERSIWKANPNYVDNWEPLFFTAGHEPRSDIEVLASKIPGWDIGSERTKGVWRFDREKAARAKKPYHDGRDPAKPQK